jgi:hypothetical protein
MAAKKHRKPTASDKTTTRRHIKDDRDQAVLGVTPTSDELALVETAPVASDSMADTRTAGMPMPAEVETLTPEPTCSNQAVPVKKLSALDAAARVLGESGQAMNCQELIAAMAAKGYWSSPKGKTPAGTLYSAILRELQTKKEQARFRKSQRGKFELRQEG